MSTERFVAWIATHAFNVALIVVLAALVVRGATRINGVGGVIESVNLRAQSP